MEVLSPRSKPRKTTNYDGKMFIQNWHMHQCDEGIMCVGYIFGSGRFEDNRHIHTSYIESIFYDEERKIVVVITHSKHEYILKLEDMNINTEVLKETKTCLKHLHIYKKSIDGFIKLKTNLQQERWDSRKKEINEILEDGDLYLIVGNSCLLEINYKDNDRVYQLNEDERIQIDGTWKHVFHENDNIIFRYSGIRFNYMYLDYISKCVKRIVIKNMDNYEFVVGWINCPAGVTTVAVLETQHYDFYNKK